MLQAGENEVQEVINHLQACYKVTHLALLGNNCLTEDTPWFPCQGFMKETTSYNLKPLTHFLNVVINVVIHTSNECQVPSPSYLTSLQFEPHGVRMKEVVKSERPLKPNVLGILHSPTSQKISWHDVTIIMEVKSGQKVKQVQQLTMYSHCYLTIDKGQSFSITMAFDHKKLQIQFLIFHCSGLSALPQLSLIEEAGFQSIVEHMVRILSITDKEHFGLDTRLGDIFHINHSDYESMRLCIQSMHTIASMAMQQLIRKTVYLLFGAFSTFFTCHK
jgi:hypothetical protein